MFIKYMFFLVELKFLNYCNVRGLANLPLFQAAFGLVHGYYFERTHIRANKSLDLGLVYMYLSFFFDNEVKIITSCKVKGLANMPLLV